MSDAVFVDALVAEAAKKSDLLWVQAPGQPARAVWHVWHDSAVLVVTDGLEQPNPGLAGSPVLLVLRSKDKGGRLLTVEATVRRLDPTDSDWDELARAVFAKRLNSPDGEQAIQRWRADSVLWQLIPTAEVHEQPGAMSDDDHRAVPAESEATTATRRPFHLGRATHRSPRAPR